jgi:hypothetical protein
LVSHVPPGCRHAALAHHPTTDHVRGLQLFENRDRDVGRRAWSEASAHPSDRRVPQGEKFEVGFVRHTVAGRRGRHCCTREPSGKVRIHGPPFRLRLLRARPSRKQFRKSEVHRTNPSHLSCISPKIGGGGYRSRDRGRLRFDFANTGRPQRSCLHLTYRLMVYLL